MALRVRARHIGWTALAVMFIAIAGVTGFVGWSLNPASLKPRLVEAARRATGRELTIAGDVGIKFSLVPTVSLEDVRLANPPGFSRPELVKVGRVELGLALWPLLRRQLVLEQVTLVRPDLVLEVDPSGRPNWVFARAVPPALAEPTRMEPAPVPPVRQEAAPRPNPPNPVPAVEPPRKRFGVAFRSASLVDGRFGWIDGRTRHQYFAETPRLSLTAADDEPARLAGTVVFDGRSIAISGHADLAGSHRLVLKVETGGATLTADGRIADLARARGFVGALDADVPDPAVLAPFFARLPVAALRGLTAHAELTDGGGPMPMLSALEIKVASVDLDAPGFVRLGQGARVNDVSVIGRGEAPIQVTGRLALSGVESGITGTVGDMGWLTRGASGPVAIDLEWTGASAQGKVRGKIERPERLAGLALDVAFSVPDPSLVMRDVPAALKDVALRAHLTDAPAPTAFQVTSSAGDLSGQITVSRTPRLSVEGQVWSRYLDVDLLRGRPPAMPAGVVSGAAPSSPLEALGAGTGESATGGNPGGSDGTAVGLAGSDASNGMAAPPPGIGMPPARKPHAAPVASNEPLIPDTKLPFDLIRGVDGHVAFTFGDIRVDGASIRKIDGVVTAKDGLLRLDPLTISAIAQRLNGVLVVDASKSPTTVHTEFTAPGLAMFGVLAALGLPQMATGHVAVQADLTASGDTPRALAASLNGWTGLAMEDGQIDAQLMNSWLAQLQPLHIGGPRITEIRCFAMRGEAKDGVVTIQPLAFDTAALIIEGNGDVDLRRETLALRLRPRARIGGTGIALPVRVTGPMRDPSAKIDISGKGMGGGALGGLILGGGKDVMGAAGGGDPCPRALARAREGVPGEGAPK